MERLSYC